MSRKAPWAWGVGASAGLVGAILLFLLHTRNPLAEPEWTVQVMTQALQRGDLARLETALTPDQGAALIEYFGEWRYRQAREIYDKMYMLGIKLWNDYKIKAEKLAAQGYEELHQRVVALGREALQKLSFEQQQALLFDRAKLDVFLYREGHARLPPEERRSIPDIEAFRQRRDRQQFITQQMWTYLPEADRAVLGSPEALSGEDTPAKLRFIDRVALQGLSDIEREDIAGISRSDLQSAGAFKLRYGRPIATDALARFARRVQVTVGQRPCVYPNATEAGSLFRGNESNCAIVIAGLGNDPTMRLSLTLRRTRGRWLVADTRPSLWEVVADRVRRELDDQYRTLARQAEYAWDEWARLRSTPDAAATEQQLLQLLETMMRNRREAQKFGHPRADADVERIWRNIQRLKTPGQEPRP